MQSNRTVGLLLLVVLAIAGAISWQFLATDAPTQVPSSDTTTKPTDDPDTAELQRTDSGTEPAVEATTTREAVVAPGPAASDLPSIIGQVVGPAGGGVGDVEVVCMPGFEWGRNFDDDFDDSNPLDPQAMIERIGGRERDRVVTRTDANGAFRVRSEGTSETVRLRIKARGHLLIDRNVQRPTDSDTDVGVLTLEVGAVVSGRVVDITGNAVVGARVSRADANEDNLAAGFNFSLPGSDVMDAFRGGDISITDEAGRFELAHVAAGEFSLRARHQDFPAATRTGLSAAKGHALADILITMPRSATIRGTISGLPDDRTGLRVMATQKRATGNDPAGGLLGMLGDASELLGDMGIAYGERQCEIGSDGQFVLQGLNGDSTYRVWVAQQGRGFAGSGICSNRVEAPTDSTGVTLRYEQGVDVTFVVVDAESGAPVESLWVGDLLRGGGGLGDMLAFGAGNARQRPYPDGRVTVANLRPKEKQKLHLTIQAIGYRSLEQKDIELPKTGSLDLGTLRLDPQPVIQVTVLNAYNGRAIQGARVTLTTEQGGRGFAAMAQLGLGGATPRSGRTDAEGQCTLNTLEGQVGEIAVTSRGFAPASVTVSGSGSETRQQTIRLVEGGTVIVSVLDPDQNPVKGVTVEHRTPQNRTDRQRTDANGVARFSNLTDDLHDFRIAAARGAMGFAGRFGNRGDDEAGQAWQSVEVFDQETAELTLRKSPTATLTGIVRENGVPLEDASVAFLKGPASDNNNPVNAEALRSITGLMNRGGSNLNKSDEAGLYSLNDLPSGNHRVRVTHKGRAMPSTLPVTIRDGVNRLDIELTMTTLRGVVRDSNGNPVAGAEVTVSPKRDGGDEARQVGRLMAGIMGGRGLGGPKQNTNAQGEFELRGVAADIELVVHVTAKALCPTSAYETVASGQTKGPMQLTMLPAGRIEVTIATAQMFAAVEARFVDAGAEGIAPVTQLLRGKKGTLEGLRPGTWEVSFLSMQNRNPDSAPKRTVTVIAGQTATAAF